MGLPENRLYTVEEWSTTYIEGITLTPEDIKTTTVLEREGRISIKAYSSGVTIKTGPYVGAVSLGDIDLVVRPKFKDAQQFFKLIGYTLELEDFELLEDYVDVSFAKGWIIDVLVACLVKEINKIFIRGLIKRYKEKDENLTTPHGKINFGRLASINAKGAVSVPCRYEDLSLDVLENRILLTALNLACPWISSPALFTRAQYLRQVLSDEVKTDNRTTYLIEELDKKEDRQAHYYRKALDLCKIIFTSLVLALEGEVTSLHPAFLFNMNELFEKFLARLLKECAPSGYRIYYQSGMGGYFNSIENRISSLIPDFQIFFKGQRVLLCDAKYKLYDQRKVDPSDLYQLAVYQMVGGVENAIIYYPSSEKKSGFYELRKPDGSYLLHTQIVGIPLETILGYISKQGTINKTSREFIWRELIEPIKIKV